MLGIYNETTNTYIASTFFNNTFTSGNVILRGPSEPIFFKSKYLKIKTNFLTNCWNEKGLKNDSFQIIPLPPYSTHPQIVLDKDQDDYYQQLDFYGCRSFTIQFTDENNEPLVF